MSEMYIRVPAPVRPIEGGPEYTLEQLVTYLVDNHPSFAMPASRARAGQRLLAAFEAARDGVVGPLRQEDWQLLRDASETSPVGYCRWGATAKDGTTTELTVATRVYLPLIDAIADATPKSPAAIDGPG